MPTPPSTTSTTSTWTSTSTTFAPCADQIPECALLVIFQMIDPELVVQLCIEGAAQSCPVVCGDPNCVTVTTPSTTSTTTITCTPSIPDCALLETFLLIDPSLVDQLCSEGFDVTCPLICGNPDCVSPTTVTVTTPSTTITTTFTCSPSIPDCALLETFQMIDPALVFQLCNEGFDVICPLICGNPECVDCVDLSQTGNCALLTSIPVGLAANLCDNGLTVLCLKTCDDVVGIYC